MVEREVLDSLGVLRSWKALFSRLSFPSKAGSDVDGEQPPSLPDDTAAVPLPEEALALRGMRHAVLDMKDKLRAGLGEVLHLNYFIDLAPVFSTNVAMVIRSFQAATPSTLRSALDLFVETADRRDLELLLKVGADINGIFDRETALSRAVSAGHAEAVEVLVDAGADLEKRETRGNLTPLQIACRGRRFEIIKFLIARGANVKAESTQRVHPLQEAASDPQMPADVVTLLKAHGLDEIPGAPGGPVAVGAAGGAQPVVAPETTRVVRNQVVATFIFVFSFVVGGEFKLNIRNAIVICLFAFVNLYLLLATPRHPIREAVVWVYRHVDPGNKYFLPHMVVFCGFGTALVVRLFETVFLRWCVCSLLTICSFALIGCTFSSVEELFFDRHGALRGWSEIQYHRVRDLLFAFLLCNIIFVVCGMVGFGICLSLFICMKTFGF